jgi:ABC-type transport system involved in multi-copper enzyme maturation permease subunit
MRLLIISVIFLIVFLIIAVWGGYIVGSANPDDPAYESGPNNVLSMVLAFTGLFPPILAIALSYDSIVGERTRRSLHLILSKPVDRSSIYIGKFLGTFLSIAIVYLIVGTLGYIVVIGMAGQMPSLEDVGRAYAAIGVILFSAACWVLFVMLFSTSFKTITSTIIFSVIFWFFILNFLSLSGTIYFMVSTSTADEPVSVDIYVYEDFLIFRAHRINDSLPNVKFELVTEDDTKIPSPELPLYSVSSLQDGNYTWTAYQENAAGDPEEVASGRFYKGPEFVPFVSILHLDNDKFINDITLNIGRPGYYTNSSYSLTITSKENNEIIDQHDDYEGFYVLKDLDEGDYTIEVTGNNTEYLKTTLHSYGDKQSRAQMFGMLIGDDIDYPGYVKATAAINPDNCAGVAQEIVTGGSSPGVVLSISEALTALTITFIYLFILGLFVFSRIELL